LLWAVVVAAAGGIGQVAMAKLMVAFAFYGGGARGGGKRWRLWQGPRIIEGGEKFSTSSTSGEKKSIFAAQPYLVML
jgi:hypothetical protein